MGEPRLIIRSVAESSQRENWTGLALFVQLPLITVKGIEWLEKRVTDPESAQSNPAVPMEEGQQWADANGYTLVRGWQGERETGLLVGVLQANPRKREDITNPPQAAERSAR